MRRVARHPPGLKTIPGKGRKSSPRTTGHLTNGVSHFNPAKGKGKPLLYNPVHTMINIKIFSRDNSVDEVLRGNTSLGRDDHEGQIILGGHQTTVRTRNSFKIGTWNVRTLFQKGKLETVKKEMKRLKFNVLGLSEVRWKGAGSFITDNFTIIYSRGDQHERGVDMLLDKGTTKSVKGFWAVSGRVLLVKLHAKSFNIPFIQGYAPTADYDDDAVTNFYEELDKAYKQ